MEIKKEKELQSLVMEIKWNFSLLHPLTNFEIRRYYQNERRSNTTYSRDNFPEKIKEGAYIINLDEYADTGTHWITLSVANIEIMYFDSFRVEHVSKEIEKFIRHKNIKTNIFIKQTSSKILAQNSIICECFCIGFINFMFGGITVINFTSLLSLYDFLKNDNIILCCFKNE